MSREPAPKIHRVDGRHNGFSRLGSQRLASNDRSQLHRRRARAAPGPVGARVWGGRHRQWPARLARAPIVRVGRCLARGEGGGTVLTQLGLISGECSGGEPCAACHTRGDKHADVSHINRWAGTEIRHLLLRFAVGIYGCLNAALRRQR